MLFKTTAAPLALLAAAYAAPAFARAAPTAHAEVSVVDPSLVTGRSALNVPRVMAEGLGLGLNF